MVPDVLPADMEAVFRQIAQHTVALARLPGSGGLEAEITRALTEHLRNGAREAATMTAWLIQQEAVPPKPDDPEVPLIATPRPRD